jgi:putative hydrolase of the HAD superfamily
MIELKNIRFWIFDLDNTLYPNTTNLFDGVDALMCKFIEDNLNVTPMEALKIKDTYFHENRYL